MQDSTPPDKEVNDGALTEEITKLQRFSLGDGAGLMQCADDVGEGDEIAVYLYQPMLNHRYFVGRVVHVADAPPIQEFTLGVRELVVRGRVGSCSDHRTQSSWSVLLAPHLVTVSLADSPEGVDVEDKQIKATVPSTDEPAVYPPEMTESGSAQPVDLIRDPHIDAERGTWDPTFSGDDDKHGDESGI